MCSSDLHVVRELSDLVRSVASKRATLELHLAPAQVSADVTQIRQVLTILLTNASDALGDDSGLIRVRTGVSTVGRNELAAGVTDRPDGEYAFVEVSDTGCGPGLAAVQGVERGHHGRIAVTTVPSESRLCTLFFPVDSAAEVTHEPSLPPVADAGSGQAILVVDDEWAVRTLVARILTRAGYRVLTASNGQEGLAAFERHANEVAVVLADVTMPDVDGLEFVTRLRASGATVPIIVMSGYSTHDLRDRLAAHASADVIQKPFSPEELAARVQLALGASAADVPEQ